MIILTQEEIMKNWIPTEDGKPIVSVRCLAYNHEKYIRRMLESMLMQKTNFPFQIVIHDDASTDKTADIIQEYAEKYPEIIVAILEEENQYSKHDGSIGRIMRPYIIGRYCCELEGDDFWIDENKLQEQYDYLHSHPEYSLIASRRIRVDEDGYVIPYKHFKKDRIYSRQEVLHMEEMIHCSTWMYKNYFFDEKLMAKYQKFIDAGAVGDWTQLLFLADLGDIYVSKKCYSARRVILRPDADNYNSIIRYRQSKFDVKKKILLADYNMSRIEFERFHYIFPAVKHIASFKLSYIMAPMTERKYAREIYYEYYIPRTSKGQRILSNFCLWHPIVEAIKEKLYIYICKIETQNELGNKI